MSSLHFGRSGTSISEVTACDTHSARSTRSMRGDYKCRFTRIINLVEYFVWIAVYGWAMEDKNWLEDRLLIV